MDYLRLGSSGLKVSRIGLGMMSYGDAAARAWHLGEAAAEPIVARAVEAGVRLTGEEVARLEAAYRPHSILGHS